MATNTSLAGESRPFSGDTLLGISATDDQRESHRTHSASNVPDSLVRAAAAAASESPITSNRETTISDAALKPRDLTGPDTDGRDRTDVDERTQNTLREDQEKEQAMPSRSRTRQDDEAIAILKSDQRNYDTVSRRSPHSNEGPSQNIQDDHTQSAVPSGLLSPGGVSTENESPATSPSSRVRRGKTIGKKKERKVKSGRTTAIYKRFVDNWGSRELENKGSVARDHLALERTFLAWLRTSLSFASIGIAVAQLFRLSSALSSSDGSPPSKSQQALTRYGKPLGVTFLAIAVVVLLLGFQRYFESQHWIIKGKFPASRGSIVTITLITVSLIIASFVVILLSAAPNLSGH